LALTLGQGVCPLEFDGLDKEAAGIGRFCRLGWLGFFAWQVLERRRCSSSKRFWRSRIRSVSPGVGAATARSIAKKHSDATTSLVLKADMDMFDPSIQKRQQDCGAGQIDPFRAHQTLRIAFSSENGHFST
jgi:hypothetical protein